MQPTISVIIPSRNRPGMLREAVASVVAQTYRPLEIIIVLTGADAETTRAARALERDYSGLIRVLVTAPLNLAATRNAGLAVARGAWVSFLDDDDLWIPDKLEKQMEAAQTSGAELVTTNWIRFGAGMPDEQWQPHGLNLDYPRMLILNNFVSVGALARTEMLHELGGFDEKMAACEDWDMWRRVSHRHEIAYVDQCLMRVRMHAGSMSRHYWMMLRAKFQHFRKMLADTPPHQRHVLRSLPRTVAAAIALFAYQIANDLSRGRVRQMWLRVKAAR